MNLSELLERSQEPPPERPRGALGRFRRRCLRHPGVDLLETDQLPQMSTLTGLTCPVDMQPVEVWEVFDTVQNCRSWVADGESGAHLQWREWL